MTDSAIGLTTINGQLRQVTLNYLRELVHKVPTGLIPQTEANEEKELVIKSMRMKRDHWLLEESGRIGHEFDALWDSKLEKREAEIAAMERQFLRDDGEDEGDSKIVGDERIEAKIEGNG